MPYTVKRRAPKVDEDAVTRGVLLSLRSQPKSWWMKCWGGPLAMAGVPDIIGCLRGRFVAIEVKAPHRRTEPHGGLSKIQKHVLDQIRAAGGITVVAYGTGDIEFLENE